MRIKHLLLNLLGFTAIGGILLSSSCKKNPPTPEVSNARVVLDFHSMWDGKPIVFKTATYTKPDSEVLVFNNWGMIISKLSLIKTDDSKILLGDGYQWIDFYTGRTKFSYADLPAGDYKGISFEFGCDSAINHGDPTIWPATHPLNGNLSGLHWSWASGYIFQALEGLFNWNKDSTKSYAFSYHTATDKYAKTYSMLKNFTLDHNTTKTANIEFWADEYFKNPLSLSLKNGAVSHSTGASELALMDKIIGNAGDVYKLIEVK